MTNYRLKYSGTGAEELFHPPLDIARGLYPDAKPLMKWAHNPSLTGLWETVWGLGGTHTFPASAMTMTISSDNANDTLTGTGAQKVLVNGLDGDYNEILEEVELNGLTPVTTTNAFFRINGLFVTQAGSSMVNAGIIYIGSGTVTAGVPATAYNAITTETHCRSASGFLTVPAGKTLYLCKLKTGSSATNGRLQSQLRSVSPTTKVDTVLAQMDTAGGVFDFEMPTPYPFEEKTDLYIRANLSGTDRPVFAIMCSVLVNNHYPESHRYWTWM